MTTVDPDSLGVDRSVLTDIIARFDGKLALNAAVIRPAPSTSATTHDSYGRPGGETPRRDSFKTSTIGELTPAGRQGTTCYVRQSTRKSTTRAVMMPSWSRRGLKMVKSSPRTRPVAMAVRTTPVSSSQVKPPGVR
jgi:hypothetical protein